MEKYADIIGILVIIFFIMAIIYSINKIYQDCKETKRLDKQIELDTFRLELDQFRIYRKYSSSENDFKMLNHIIEESIAKYKILHFGFNKDLYITDKMQDKMISDILTEVLNALSDTTFATLTVIYNKEYIEDLILSKIKIAVLDYIITVNGNYKE